jgi:hypothetical protein
MSTYGINVPAPDEINYHEARQAQRVQTAFRALDPGDVIATVESRLSQESDPTQHPLYQLTLFFLDRAHACDGGQLFDDWKRLILAAIDTCLTEALSRGED